ncbi:hypothetical protein TNCV_958051 [Trichonephila clavipes]|nr:hypothetical protein TNCV_958051 [Trichonephila clavipes]
MKERRIRSGYLPFRTQVLYRPRQNDRLRVMFGTSLYISHTATVPSRHGGTVNSRRAASPLVRLVIEEEGWGGP